MHSCFDNLTIALIKQLQDLIPASASFRQIPHFSRETRVTLNHLAKPVQFAHLLLECLLRVLRIAIRDRVVLFLPFRSIRIVALVKMLPHATPPS